MSRARVHKKKVLQWAKDYGIPRSKLLTGHWLDNRKYFREVCGLNVRNLWSLERSRIEFDREGVYVGVKS